MKAIYVACMAIFLLGSSAPRDKKLSSRSMNSMAVQHTKMLLKNLRLLVLSGLDHVKLPNR